MEPKKKTEQNRKTKTASEHDHCQFAQALKTMEKNVQHWSEVNYIDRQCLTHIHTKAGIHSHSPC